MRASASGRASLILHSVALRDAIVCLSFANLSCIRLWEGTLAYSKADAFYMHTRPSPADDLAIPIVVVTLAALLWAGVRMARRYLSRDTLRILRPAGMVLLILPLNSLRLSNTFTRSIDLIALLTSTKAEMVIVPVVVLAIWIGWKWQRQMIGVVLTLITILFTFTLGTFAESIRAAILFDGQIPDQPLAASLPVFGNSNRVVWMIFDEWDYGLAFEHRPPDLLMPAVDRLRNESFFASDAEAPTLQTATSVPAMLMGKVPRVGADGIAWDRTSTIFSAARQNGINTAIVGWYLPYCRVFSSVLTDCAWWSMPNALNSNGDTFGGKVKNDFFSLLETGARGFLRQPAAMQAKVRMIEEFQARAQADVAKASLGFIFLHVPVPHPPHPYNRASRAFDVRNSRSEGYFDSLALVDTIVANLRTAMERSGTWEKTTILVSADHPLRQAIGKFDIRVPFLLKFPGDTTTLCYSPHIRTIITADLVLSILRGEISNRGDALTWLSIHGNDQQLPIEEHGQSLGLTPN